MCLGVGGTWAEAQAWWPLGRGQDMGCDLGRAYCPEQGLANFCKGFPSKYFGLADHIQSLIHIFLFCFWKDSLKM